MCPAFALMTAWTQTGMNSKSLCKTCTLMLSQHDLHDLKLTWSWFNTLEFQKILLFYESPICFTDSMDSSWHGLHKFVQKFTDSSRPDLTLIQRRSCTWISECRSIWCLLLCALMRECTWVGMDSTRLCRVCWLWLSQHDLKVTQRAFCTWIWEYFIIWWVQMLFYWQNALGMDSTSLCKNLLTHVTQAWFETDSNKFLYLSFRISYAFVP